MSRVEKVEKVRAWWLANDQRGLTATAGAAECAEALSLPLNSVRGLQRDAFLGRPAPWQDGYRAADAASKTCPRCKCVAHGQAAVGRVFGFRKVWRGGQRRFIPQSYCITCR